MTTNFVQMYIESKQNSRTNFLTKDEKKTQKAMVHGSLENDQIIFEIDPVCEKLKRTEVGSKLDEINLKKVN